MEKPLYVDIDKATLENEYYRRVIYTDSKMQVVLMSLAPGQKIDLEKHSASQFFRCEAGEGKIVIEGESKDYILVKDAVVVIPHDKFHEVSNTSSTERLQLYTIYAQPMHAPGALQLTKPVNDD